MIGVFVAFVLFFGSVSLSLSFVLLLVQRNVGILEKIATALLSNSNPSSRPELEVQ
jgi:hypothetical protein